MTHELKRVLCIDDDTDILEVTRICLQTVGGFEVFVCIEGAGALDRVRQVLPDIILLDVMMPGIDGPTVLTSLQSDPALINIPVVFMTARVQPREVNEYIAQGAAAVIAKPFDPMQLAAEIAEIWKKGRQRSGAS